MTDAPIELTVADIGGTHARFALASVQGGRVAQLGEAVTFKVADYASLPLAWRAFAATTPREPPKVAAIALACPIEGEVLKLTNNPWVLRPATLAREIGVEKLEIINDFGAVAHAVAQIDPAQLIHVCGPHRPLPQRGVISIVGPGTGLGVAQLLRAEKAYHVVECEGGHVDFAPLDAFEDELLRRMRQQFTRVSVERIASGPGLAQIYAALPGQQTVAPEDKILWSTAIQGEDPLARAALDHFCLCLGAIVGDIALTHGAKAVVLAGGLPPRIAHLLPTSGFAQRLTAKGRFAAHMADLPVWLIAHPQPGLFGAAAFAARHDG